MCRGPAPARVATKGGSFGVSFPFAASRRNTKNPIESQIRHGDKPAVRIKDGVVRVRARLPFSIWPRFAGQGYQITARPQGSVLLDRYHADRAGAVIGGDNPAAGRVDRQVHRVLAAAGLPIERCDMAVLLVDRIGADLVEVGMHRVEKALSPVERQERGVCDLEELLVGPRARGRVHPVDVDAAAVPLALRRRKGADISDQHGFAVGAGLRLSMPATQCRGPRRRERGSGLQHKASVGVPVSRG